MNLTIQEAAKFLSVKSFTNNPEKIITGICMDSRAIKKGDCFFAIKGENFDGHNFVDDVLAKGAVCAIVNNDFNGTGSLLKVDNTIEAMGKLANLWRNKLGLKIVGITGSVGKTTTRNLIHHILSGFMSCYQSMKNFNNQIGLPFAILNIPEGTQSAVIEMGASEKGEIGYLSKITEPDIAIITNTYPAHLEGFGSLENIIKEKAAIAGGLKKGGKLIVNSKMANLIEYLNSAGRQYETFEVKNGQTNGETGSLEIDGSIQVQVPLAGWGNLENTAAAWQVCKNLGITAQQFTERMKTASPWQMRLEILKLQRFTLINDCYNANPASMNNAIDILTDISKKDKNRPVFICGDMKELGSESKNLHSKLGEKIAKSGVRVLLACGNFAQVIADTVLNITGKTVETALFNNSQELADKVGDFLKTDDIILIKGSRSIKLETVVEKIKGL